MRLQVGLGAVSKVLACVAAMAVVAIATGLLGAVHGWWQPGGVDVGEPPKPLVWFISGLAVVMIAGAAWAMLHALTYGARLDGTTVTVSGPFGSTRVDLARSTEFWFEERTEHSTVQQGSYDVHLSWQVPLLCARNGRSTVKVPLSSGGRRLPRRQLEALGGAIHAGQDYRDPWSAEHAHAVVHALFSEAARI